MNTKLVKKSNFKQGITEDDSRRRREAAALSIRKDKKEEGIAKRRNMTVITETSTSSSDTNDSFRDLTSPQKSYNILDVPELMIELNSQDIDRQYLAVKGFRKLLSVEENPPIRQCIDSGALSAFVHFLQPQYVSKIQFESAWALTNIASSNETKVVVEYGAIPLLTQLLTSPDANVREQCAWCLGNVAGDSAALRDIVLNHGALMPLLANIAQPANVTLLRNCIWSLSNMCRGKPQPPLALIASALPTLANILLHNSDQSSIIDAIWALSYISDGDNNRIQSVVNTGVVPKLVQFLASDKPTLIVPALRTLGNIVTGSDDVTEVALNADLLSVVPKLLEHSKKNIRKETCWMLSNIAAGSANQINKLMYENADIVPRVLGNLAIEKEWDVRKEACWVICNILSEAKKNPSHVARLVEYGTIKHLCDMLSSSEVHMITLALNGLEVILKCDQNLSYRDLFDEAEGIEKIEDLQNHAKHEVYQKAGEIIEKYFGGEEVDESENIAPATQGNVFAFGAPVQGSIQKTFDFSGAKQQGLSTGAPSAFGFNQNSNRTPTAFSFGTTPGVL